MSGWKLTAEQIEQIPILRLQGMSYSMIAQKLGLKNHTSIMYWLGKIDLTKHRMYARRAKGYFGKPRERIIKSGIEKQTGGIYEDYLKKYRAKENGDLPISVLFADKMKK